MGVGVNVDDGVGVGVSVAVGVGVGVNVKVGVGVGVGVAGINGDFTANNVQPYKLPMFVVFKYKNEPVSLGATLKSSMSKLNCGIPNVLT